MESSSSQLIVMGGPKRRLDDCLTDRPQPLLFITPFFPPFGFFFNPVLCSQQPPPMTVVSAFHACRRCVQPASNMTKYVGREENEIKKRSGRKIKISFFIDCSIRRREDGILSSYTAGWFVVTIVVYNSGYSDVRIFQIFPGVQDYFFFSFFFFFGYLLRFDLSRLKRRTTTTTPDRLHRRNICNIINNHRGCTYTYVSSLDMYKDELIFTLSLFSTPKIFPPKRISGPFIQLKSKMKRVFIFIRRFI